MEVVVSCSVLSSYNFDVFLSNSNDTRALSRRILRTDFGKRGLGGIESLFGNLSVTKVDGSVAQTRDSTSEVEMGGDFDVNALGVFCSQRST